MDDNRPKTVTEVAEQLQRTETLLRNVEFVKSYTIDDYPIGGANRGKCELSYEYKKGKGYRTVRRTTDKRGLWCKPKSSTFQPSPIAVIHGVDLKHEAAWLRCDYYGHGMYLQWANGDNEYLCQAPFSSQPRRTEERYTMVITTAKMVIGADGVTAVPTKAEEREERVLPAASAEDIALWDAFMSGYRPMFNQVWRAANETLALESAAS